ncbi:MAG: GNAT family N-acetyltransferase, partial [Aigarchaeota archaeon]|nr:GNAT family N-acetyltransferase [Aigarchaeota archaeon]
KPIIALPSTTSEATVSRIVPHLDEGAGVVTTRGDIHYIVTEHGIAYLHGKTIRDRALALINVADPKFRPWLLGAAKQLGYLPADQAEPRLRFTGYPEDLEKAITLKNNLRVLLRPVKPTDETAMKDLFYSFSDDTIYHRFFGILKSMPHSRLQYFVNVDYEDRMGIVATAGEPESEQIVALATYDLEKSTNMAEVAIVIHDHWQNLGLGTHLVEYLARVARERGISGFTAEVLADNPRAMKILHKIGYPVESKMINGTYQVTVKF